VFHLAEAHKTLRDQLHWPNDPARSRGVARHLGKSFQLSLGEVVATSKDLAIRLADLAMRIRKRANRILTFETEAGPLRKLHSAFRRR